MEDDEMDILYIALTLLFFALSIFFLFFLSEEQK
jgi:hypothetical protein